MLRELSQPSCRNATDKQTSAGKLSANVGHLAHCLWS